MSGIQIYWLKRFINSAKQTSLEPTHYGPQCFCYYFSNLQFSSQSLRSKLAGGGKSNSVKTRTNNHTELFPVKWKHVVTCQLSHQQIYFQANVNNRIAGIT